MIDETKSKIEELKNALTEKWNTTLLVKRDDLIHKEVSGNKWRKLKYSLLQASQNKNVGVITFGGAFSNHLVATAAACSAVGLPSVGVVRGEELNENSNDTLRRCAHYGMNLKFISRDEYNLRNERTYHEGLLDEFPNHFVVPEGGANYLGMIGCQEITKEISEKVDVFILAQGTTTTSCGILLSLGATQKLDVIPVLKGYDALNEMKTLMMKSGLEDEFIDDKLAQATVFDHYHFGGYAKVNDDLINFIRQIHSEFGLKLDPVYTGKAFYALWDQLSQGRYHNQTICFIHTGGLQGAAPFEAHYGPLFSGEG